MHHYMHVVLYNVTLILVAIHLNRQQRIDIQ